jgi:hypothetical protein
LEGTLGLGDKRKLTVLQSPIEHSYSRLEHAIDLRDDASGMPFAIDAAQRASRRTKQPACCRDFSAPQLRSHLIKIAGSKLELELTGFVRLYQRSATLPEVLNAHRYVKPVQNVHRVGVGRMPDRIGQRRITIAEHDNLASWQPALRPQAGADGLVSRSFDVWHRCEMRGAATGRLEASHDNLEMSRLEPGNCADICAVNEHRNRAFRGAAHSVWRLVVTNLDLISHATKT